MMAPWRLDMTSRRERHVEKVKAKDIDKGGLAKKEVDVVGFVSDSDSDSTVQPDELDRVLLDYDEELLERKRTEVGRVVNRSAYFKFVILGGGTAATKRDDGDNLFMSNFLY